MRNTVRQPTSLSPAARLTVAALLAAALGFAIQIAAGVEVPAVPPGLVMLLRAAGLVAFLPRRWTPAIGARGTVPVRGVLRERRGSRPSRPGQARGARRGVVTVSGVDR